MDVRVAWRSFGSIGTILALLLAALLIPASLFGVVAWKTRTEALAQAARSADKTVTILHGHAQHIFETYELVMDRIEDRLRTESWPRLDRSADFHAFLQEIVTAKTQIGSIQVYDADGNLQNTSLQFPPPVANASDREYMQAFRSGYRGTFIGEIVTGRVTGQIAFNVARPLVNDRGELIGALLLSVYPDYFVAFYQRAAMGFDYSAGLVRSDGKFLVRDAESKISVDQPRASETFMAAIAKAPEGRFPSVSAVDGIRRIVAYKKLDHYPVYVLFAFGTDAVLAEWRRTMVQYLIFAIPAVIGLMLLSGLALVQIRREQEVTRRLRTEMQRREATEAKLIRAQRMEALGQMTGGIAHDFNNLLTIVMGNLDLLRRAKEDRRERLIDNALQAVEQGRKITTHLLAFGRRQSLHPEVVNLNGLIAGMDDMLAQSLRENISLDLDLAPDLWRVEIDPSQLQVALINLAANARDAMPEGGSFRIKTENVVLQGPDAADVVAITVSDTGAGIDPEVLPRVFEPFFTTKDVGKGSGLGLAQVYGFAEQSGGAVEVRSALGRGTCVLLTLPRSTAPLTVPETLPAPRGETGVIHARILLVEDNPQVAEVAAALLREHGHTVTVAPNARAALDVLQSGGAIDVVVSDMVMPGDMGGFELAQNLRQKRPDLPVILVTGYSEEASRAGLEGFTLLRKPYAPHLLAQTVQAELRARFSRTVTQPYPSKHRQAPQEMTGSTYP